MRHGTKIIIDGIEVMAGAEEEAPAIFDMKLENIACNSPLQIGAVTTDRLDVTISNPFKPSFDGSIVELWVSPEEPSELDTVDEITDDVGDESIDEVIDIEDATEDSDDEEGEALTDEEITDVEETEEADTIEQFEILEGEASIDSVDESVGEDAEWHKLGTYHVTQQTAVANGVRLLCYDNISRLAIPFSLEADKTLQSEYSRLVSVLADNGITLEPREMPDRNVGTNYTGTCRDALGYFAGLLGGFASCDEDGSIDISSYVVTDAVLIAEELLTYIGASAGEMTVGGFILKDKNGVELASVGDGQSISVVDPLMIDSDLDELMTMYAGLRFEGATLSARWNESLAAGTLVRVFTRAEYENYLKLLNNETISDEIKAMANSLGKLVLISSQTIIFGGDTTTVIKSVCNSEADKIIQQMSGPIGEKIEAAAETATNYLNQDETGALVISNDKTDGNVRLDYDSVDVRRGDRVVASFGEETVIGGDRAYHLNLKPNRISMAYKSDEVFYVEGTFTKLPPSGATIYDLGKGEISRFEPAARILVAGSYSYPAGYYRMDFTDIPEIDEIYYVYLEEQRTEAALQALCYAYIYFSDLNTIYIDLGEARPLEVRAKVETNIVGDIDVAGEITLGGHDSPIGTRLSGAIADTQATSTTTTKHTITLPEGVWILTVNICFGNKTTISGSTSTTAGNRAVILSTSDATYTGAQVASSSYAEAGKSVRVQVTSHVVAESGGKTMNVRLYSANNCATTLGHWSATRIA